MNKDNMKCYKYNFDMNVLNIMAIILFFVVGGMVYLLEYGDNYNFSFDWISLLVVTFLWLVLHEILHGIGFSLFKSVDRKNIIFGMYLEMGVFYCMCKQKIGKEVILTSLVFPVMIIGVFTLVIGMIINSFMLVYLSVLNIVASIGDIVMIIYFVRVSDDVLYLDLDDCTSFYVLSNSDISDIKVWGIKLDNVLDYNSKSMKSNNFRKVVISRYSYVMLVIIFILIIIKLVGGIL